MVFRYRYILLYMFVCKQKNWQLYNTSNQQYTSHEALLECLSEVLT